MEEATSQLSDTEFGWMGGYHRLVCVETVVNTSTILQWRGGANKMVTCAVINNPTLIQIAIGVVICEKTTIELFTIFV